MTLNIAKAQRNYIISRDRSLLNQIEYWEKIRLKILDPATFHGDSRTNQLIINRMNEERIYGEMIMRGIHDPNKLSVLRFYILMFKLEKKKNPQQDEK